MDIKGLAHIGIPTQQLEKSVEFYKKLGFLPIHRCGEGEKDTVVLMQCADVTIELYEEAQGETRAGAIHHIAFQVEDIHAAYQWVVAQGFQVAAPGIVTLPWFSQFGSAYFMIYGMNGEWIECNQTLSGCENSQKM